MKSFLLTIPHPCVYTRQVYHNILDYSFNVKIKQHFENVNSNYKELKAFLIGLLSFITYIDVFKDFKDFNSSLGKIKVE